MRLQSNTEADIQVDKLISKLVKDKTEGIVNAADNTHAKAEALFYALVKTPAYTGLGKGRRNRWYFALHAKRGEGLDTKRHWKKWRISNDSMLWLTWLKRKAS